jgi:hypothetical protein
MFPWACTARQIDARWVPSKPLSVKDHYSPHGRELLEEIFRIANVTEWHIAIQGMNTLVVGNMSSSNLFGILLEKIREA